MPETRRRKILIKKNLDYSRIVVIPPHTAPSSFKRVEKLNCDFYLCVATK